MKINLLSVWLLASLFISNGCTRTKTSAACIDPKKANPNIMCTAIYDPVCGCDGKTYSNACAAGRAGVLRFTKGECETK